MTKGVRPHEFGEFQAGVEVGAGYRLVGRLGRGAFGKVWQAEAPGGVPVALKIISGSLTEKEVQVARNALRVTKRLRHGYLLQRHAFWAMQDRLLIAMELADGSLRDRHRECQAEGLSGIPVEELLPYVEQSASALDYLHENRLLHCDVTPATLLRLGKAAKLADLGLAMVLPGTVRSVTVNSAGTTPYMGPEVWHGKACEASDQWSLAVTYVELRRGRPPFSGSNPAEMMLNIRSGAPDLAGLEEAEQEVLRQALAKEHAHRFPTCSEFTEALRGALGPILSRPKAGRKSSHAPRGSGGRADGSHSGAAAPATGPGSRTATPGPVSRPPGPAIGAPLPAGAPRPWLSWRFMRLAGGGLYRWLGYRLLDVTVGGDPKAVGHLRLIGKVNEYPTEDDGRAICLAAFDPSSKRRVFVGASRLMGNAEVFCRLVAVRGGVEVEQPRVLDSIL